ncbi:sensor histidine kinase [Pseudomonas sp. M47T1]|uniref:HAMP domain-containing protein n=1 Tax=Pseudomonas sp. M47T1 TaxID=1179778 RepID=UPI0002608AE5|nr:HAMP domain-containing protein [Pseudomonas sp. M47T1]EIK95489.1 sensor histidine kinase [Pseudomonas sp. M47T1]
MIKSRTLFARIFNVTLAAIFLAHGLTYLWIVHYRIPPPPRLGTTAQTADPALALEASSHYLLVWPKAMLAFQFLALIAMAWYVSRSLTRPLKRFSQAAERLGDNLDSRPLAETGSVEARHVASLLNRMQQSIRDQVDMRRRTLGAVSHDLRTPLSRLKLRLALLDDPVLTKEMSSDIDAIVKVLDATQHYLHDDTKAP